MKIEKLDRVAMTVKDLDRAVMLFSDLLGITFDKLPSGRVAISPSGLELLQLGTDSALLTQIPPPGGPDSEGLYCFHFKVDDLERAKKEMAKKGIRLLREIKIGTLKELIYSPDDLFGVRLVLVEYPTPTVIEATRQPPS